MSERQITVTIVRNNPETAMKPTKVRYVIPYSDRMRVMDALNYIRDNMDSSLSFRWSCRYHAKCGTCAAMINGRAGLTCCEPAVDGMTVAPLANFPVIRDLVVDRRGWDKRVTTELRGIIASEVDSKKA